MAHVQHLKFLTVGQRNMLTRKGFSILADHCIDGLRRLVTTGEAEFTTHIKLYADAMEIQTSGKAGFKLRVLHRHQIAANVVMETTKQREAREVATNMVRKNAAEQRAIDMCVDAIQIDIHFVKDYARLHKMLGDPVQPSDLFKTSIDLPSRSKTTMQYYDGIFDALLKRNKMQINNEKHHRLSVMERIHAKVRDNWLFRILTSEQK